MDVRWRVLNRNGEYQVVDVALNIDGNLLWLAIEQRAQFLSLLDRTNGSADALVAKIEEMTGTLQARAPEPAAPAEPARGEGQTVAAPDDPTDAPEASQAAEENRG